MEKEEGKKDEGVKGRRGERERTKNRMIITEKSYINERVIKKRWKKWGKREGRGERKGKERGGEGGIAEWDRTVKKTAQSGRERGSCTCAHSYVPKFCTGSFFPHVPS